MNDRALVHVILGDARTLLANTAYDHRFIASRDGAPCNPRLAPDTLSIRGAIMCATSNNRDVDMVIAWLRDHLLLPGVEPRSKDHALAWFDRALATTKRGANADVSRRLAS